MKDVIDISNIISFKMDKNREKIQFLSYQVNFEIFDAILTNEIRLKNLKKLLDE